MIDAERIQDFQEHGYVLARGLFSSEEVEFYKRHYMDLAGENETINCDDPLQKYPYILQIHRWDDVMHNWLLDERIRQYLNAFLGRDPYAVQSTFYFKPPGGPGHALHQDQFFLRVRPGISVAAWLALDPCDESNGCLQMVPGTGDLPLLCPTPTNTTESIINMALQLPDGLTPESIVMDPGDVLFFNGAVIHGSFPNKTTNRFRRSMIGHYIASESEQIAAYSQPVPDHEWGRKVAQI